MYRRLFKKSYCRDYLDYICVDQCGKLLRPNYVTMHFSWLIEKYGFARFASMIFVTPAPACFSATVSP